MQDPYWKQFIWIEEVNFGTKSSFAGTFQEDKNLIDNSSLEPKS